MKISVFIVDDHKIFRDGLKMLFSTLPQVELIGEASSGKSFLEALESIVPDIVFMDINMKEMDGIEASKIALDRIPDLKIVALTSFDDEEYFFKMADIGVKGYLLKNSSIEDFEKAISKISEGYNYFSDELVTKLARKIYKNNEKGNNIPNLNFSDEEKVLLKYVCEGLTNKQIADVLFLSPRTVEAHRAKLLEKSNTKNSVALAVYAISNKIVEVNL